MTTGNTPSEIERLLTRIAEALEAQNETSKGWIALQVGWRSEAQYRQEVSRRDALAQRDEELAELRRANDALLEQLRSSLRQGAQIVAIHERHLSSQPAASSGAQDVDSSNV